MDKGNPMYNLAREVLKEKDNTIVINGKTLDCSIDEISKLKPNFYYQEYLL